ncbi:hypothetical protein C789_4751 [Microcystis aeruginosa FACHB-905 = DIANCHI905]|uniref:Uncharacterized protein n=1 Tax=Microcystis aeruginosa PCC 7806SL TaxID=1903187 RepID=A0AB33BWQ4_MICA7|nr:hypothetical protein BH695_3232 [Microcystis aeruginosa PCC 7806SL]ELS45432.1 hypothetical protein C789_4751 [Microcystis aeruginosa FACHB-905 = DIANCHI905]
MSSVSGVVPSTLTIFPQSFQNCQKNLAMGEVIAIDRF